MCCLHSSPGIRRHIRYFEFHDGKVLKRYERRTLLGKGSYGTVWECKDESTGELVAIKETAEEDEALVYDFLERTGVSCPELMLPKFRWCRGGKFFFVMRRAEGDLWSAVRARGLANLGPSTLLRYALEGANGLKALHDLCLVHGDVKPDNMLLVGGHLKVSDLGFCTGLEEGPFEPMSGCDFTAPPEWLQDRHEREYGLEGDMWGLGVVLCCGLLGHSPFTSHASDDHLRMEQYMLLKALHPWEAIPEAPRPSNFEPRTDYVRLARIIHSCPHPLQYVVRGLLRHQPSARLTAAQVVSFLQPCVTDTPRKQQPRQARRRPASMGRPIDARMPLQGHLHGLLSDGGVQHKSGWWLYNNGQLVPLETEVAGGMGPSAAA